MAIPILPTSFFGNPDPQGSINGNIARLAVEAGEALTKRVEQNAIQNEAALKAPVIGKIYGNAFQQLAAGDTSGLAGLAQANAIAGGNPILNQMNSDAFHLGTSVLNDANTRNMLATRLDAENKMLGQRLSTEQSIASERNATSERNTRTVVQGREDANAEANFNRQYNDVVKERQKLQDKYQQDHDVWKELTAAGKDAGPEPQMPMLPELPKKPEKVGAPTLPGVSGGATADLFPTDNTPVASATPVSVPGTVKQPDGTIAPEPALPVAAQAAGPSLPSTPVQPPTAAAAAPSPAPQAGAPAAAAPATQQVKTGAGAIVVNQPHPDGTVSHYLNNDTLRSADVVDALKRIGVNPGSAIEVASNKDGTVGFADNEGHVGKMGKEEFALTFAEYQGLEKIKFGDGTLLVPLVDEKKDTGGKTTISGKIGSLTRTYTEGSTAQPTQPKQGFEGEKQRLREEPFSTLIKEFGGNDLSPKNQDIINFWEDHLSPNGGKGIQVVPLDKKRGDKEPTQYALIGYKGDGTRERFALPGQSAEETYLTPDQAAAVTVLSEKFPQSGAKYIPPSVAKERPGTVKFDNPSEREALDNLKQQAKDEGWSQEKFITESQKIGKGGMKILDLPPGMKQQDSGSDLDKKRTADAKAAEIEHLTKDAKYELGLISDMENSSKQEGGLSYSGPILNDRKQKLSKIRARLRELGVDPDKI